MVRSFGLPCLLTTLAVLFTPASARSALPPSDQVLPATTKAYLSVGHMPKLLAAWKSTPLGRLLDDPAMESFNEDLKRQLHDKGMLLQDRLGISLTDLEQLPTGEMALALIRLPDDKAASVVLIDVSNNLAAAGAMIQKVDGVLTRGGAHRSMHNSQFAKAPLTVYEIPPKGGRKQVVHAVYFIENDVLGVSDNLAVAEEVLSRMAAPKADSLASVPSYEAVMQRCAKQGGQFESHLKWWIDPISAAEAVLNSLPQKPSRDLIQIAHKEGFTAIQAIGGLVSFATKPYGMLHRTTVIAPPPYERAMAMLKFPSAKTHEPEGWVPAGVSNYMTFQWDMKNAFEHFGTLFDEIVGGGEEGIWEDVLDSMKNDPNGPQLDVEKELIVHLGTRCSILTDNVQPIGLHSQRRLFAAEVTDEKAVAAAVEKLMKNDQAIKLRTFKTGDLEYKIFEIIPEDNQVPMVEIEAVELKPVEPKPATGEAPGNPNGAKPIDVIIDPVPGAPPPEHAKEHALPHSAVTVGLGYLFISSHVDLLEQILAHPKAPQPLALAHDYQHITTQCEQLNASLRSAQGFTRNDERFWVPYELFRDGRLTEADLPLREVLDALAEETEEGQIRKQRLDGRKLPDYAVVRKYLGLGGAFVQSEEQGWFIIGFTMDEKNPPQAAQASRAPAASE